MNVAKDKSRSEIPTMRLFVTLLTHHKIHRALFTYAENWGSNEKCFVVSKFEGILKHKFGVIIDLLIWSGSAYGL